MEPEAAGSQDTSALEQFRQQWKEEVNARSKQSTKDAPGPSQPRKVRKESTSRAEKPANIPLERHPLADAHDHDDDDGHATESGLAEQVESLQVKDVDADDFSSTTSSNEPKNALEHYERAVEKESQGNLGASLSHYRKAYRLDAKVDQSYRNKHFPGKWKNSSLNPSKVMAAVSSPTTQVPEQPEAPISFEALIGSYAGLPIMSAKPIIEGDREPPCPISRLPAEVLIELLWQVATRDPGVFARLALVCKRFAYHVFTDSSIWKRVALGPEFGLASQHYRFATDVQGREAIFRALQDEEEEAREEHLPPVDESLFENDTDYRDLFHTHPRIRFSGVYISTVNYTRAGGVSATPGTWNSTVHIVTYYRYLRFFRDGTVISLLTTNEPIEVVHYLTKENLALVRPLGKAAPSTTHLHQSKDGPTIPVATQNMLRLALRGRWRLVHPNVTDPADGDVIGANSGIAGDLHLETEGAAPRYTYTLHLSLKSTSRSKHTTKNNKLVWKGFWKYNHLTDDWAEFALKNDKAFLFSRVKSYGLGY